MKHTYSVPKTEDSEYKSFLQKTIATNIKNRLTASECLDDPFLKIHYIPPALPLATYSATLCKLTII